MLRQAARDGDLSYASPEQIRGDPLHARSLVFSMGVLLFQRITGHHPFGAEDDDQHQVERIRRGEMGSGVNHFPRLAAGLRPVLVRAMWPAPEERWTDLCAMRERLAHFVEMVAREPRLPGINLAREGRGPAALLASRGAGSATRDSVSGLTPLDRVLGAQVDPLAPTLPADSARALRGERDVVVDVSPAVPTAAAPLPLPAPVETGPVATLLPRAASADHTLIRPAAASPRAAAPRAGAPTGTRGRVRASALISIGLVIGAGAGVTLGFRISGGRESTPTAAYGAAQRSESFASHEVSAAAAPPPWLPPQASSAIAARPSVHRAPEPAPRSPRQAAATAIAPCFTAARGEFSFGLTLVVTSGGTIQKVYFGGDDLVSGERRCMAERLRGARYRSKAGLIQLQARVDESGPRLRAVRKTKKKS